MPNITEGAKGDTVRLAQQRLIQCGYDLGSIDGDFGPRPLAATRQFQSDLRISRFSGTSIKGLHRLVSTL